MAAYEWTAPWVPVDNPVERARLEAELVRELSREHVLFGVPVRVIGRREDVDDYLFEILDGRCAEVHLTWSDETLPQWPAAEIYSGWDEWTSSKMMR